MRSEARTVDDYLAQLPPDRRATIAAVRKVIRDNLGEGYEEGMQYGMVGYYVPHRLFPAGYHCDPKQPVPFASLASQKNHLSLYLFCTYCSPAESEWFRAEWAKAGKRLDMGKSCIRFKRVDDLALDVIARALRRAPLRKFLKSYQAALVPAPAPSVPRARASRAERAKSAVKPAPAKRTAAPARKVKAARRSR